METIRKTESSDSSGPNFPWTISGLPRQLQRAMVRLRRGGAKEYIMSMQALVARVITEDTIILKVDDTIDGIVHVWQSHGEFFIGIIDKEFDYGPYGWPVGPFSSLDVVYKQPQYHSPATCSISSDL